MSKYAYFAFGDLLDAEDVSEEFLRAVMRCSEFQQVVEVESYDPGRPAQIRMDPNDSYPEEPAEIELSESAETLAEKALRDVMNQLPLKFACPPNEVGFHELLALRGVIQNQAHAEIARIELEYLADLENYDEYDYERDADDGFIGGE